MCSHHAKFVTRRHKERLRAQESRAGGGLFKSPKNVLEIRKNKRGGAQMTDLTRRFAFIDTQEDGSQNLVLADEVESRGFPSHTLSRPRVINTPLVPDDDLSESYSGLTTSPSNRYLAASSNLSDRSDDGVVTNWLNNTIYSMLDGSRLCTVNQRDFSGLNRWNTHSAAYDALLALQASRGMDSNMLAQDTFQVSIDPRFAPATAQVVGPVWLQDETFLLGYRLNIFSLLDPSWVGVDTFVLEFGVEGKIRRHNADMYLKPPRRQADPFEIRTTAAGASAVFYRGSELEVRIHSPSRHPPPNFRSVVPVTAEFVAGYAPLA